MLPTKLRCFARPVSQALQPFRSFASAAESTTPLPLMSAAVLVERLPVVIPKPPEWFIDYEIFSFERNQPLRKQYPADFLEAAAEPPSDDTKKVLAEGEVDMHTTTDFSTFFDDPSRRTQADETNNTKSTQRALDKRLYLVVKAGGAAPAYTPASLKGDLETERWRLPEALYAQEDSLRQCAEGAIGKVIASSGEDVYFVGNAPFGHLEQSQEESGHQQFKRFFFWAHWLGQEAALTQGNVKDFAWVTREELLSHLTGTREAGILQELLLD